MLGWAREEAGFTSPEEVDAELGLYKGTIREWESGAERPDIKDLRQLSELYDCPFSYFFLSGVLQEPPPIDLRGSPPNLRRPLSQETKRVLRDFRRLARVASNLQVLTGLTTALNIGSPGPNTPLDTTLAQKLAEQEVTRLGITDNERNSWTKAQNAYRTWRNAVESLGIFVFSLWVPPKECRGAALSGDHLAPAILVKRNNEPYTARNFTLLHEYAHLMLRQSGQILVCDHYPSQTETFANTFASFALVPEEMLSRHLDKRGLNDFRDDWTDSSLESIALEFKVSRDVIAIRLEARKLAPSGFYRMKRERWDRAKERGGGFSTTHVTKREQVREKVGDRLFDLIVGALRRGEVTHDDARSYLGRVGGEKRQTFVSPEEIEKWRQR
jgi:Zn-dependent peptidase ImmA (M78 family)